MLRRSGQISRARRMLGQAVGAAETVGAGWLAGLAARELAIAGGRRRQAPAGGLTSQELRVATLAAAGKSNAELARQLSVSVNTVETHLRHIYAKTGVRSRLQLAHYLTEKAAAAALR
jgi:DNA-binding CsgD family transcriptional regulator